MNFSLPVKKAITLLLVVFIFLTQLTGCGKKAPKKQADLYSEIESTADISEHTDAETEGSDSTTDSESAETSDGMTESETAKTADTTAKADKTEAEVTTVPKTTEKAKPTERPTEKPKPTEQSTEKTKPTEKPTENSKPTKSKLEKYVDSMTIEQQVAQMFFARCPSNNAVSQIKQYQPGGYVLFARDFANQTPSSVKKIISEYQTASKTPMLIGVDEEGGTVVRVSKYPAFRSSPFLSSADIYSKDGLNGLIKNTAEKDALLKSLEINVNLAPVCDVSQDPSDYIYKRTLGRDGKETAECIKAIVTQMKKDKVGATLKHFPGYGSNVDTHTGIAVDTRSIESFRQNDFLPFIAGINAGAGAVMVNHNIINCMDSKRPASLSPAVNKVLRNELGFKGVIMTDDLSMSAITKYTDGKNAAVSAVIAGSDMLISSDFVNQYNAVLSAVQNGTISKSRIRQSCLRIVQWKVNLGLISL